MHVALTDEQELLAKTADQLAAAIGTETPADLEARDRPDRWDLLADAGWLGLRVPGAAGGTGASGVEVAVVAEALGRALCREPFLGSAVLATELLALAGADADMLGALAAGERRLAVAVDGVAFDARGAEGALVIDGDRVVLAAFDVPPLEAVDLTRVLYRVGSPVDEVGIVDGDARARWEAMALAALSADLVGVMDGALGAAVAHARERVQFDRPIGSFQAIQHLCADALVSVEAARSATWYAAWAVDGLDPHGGLLAGRVAKAYASAAGRKVCEAAIQVFGGIGITWEAMPHLYLRRALLDRATLGDERVQHQRIADVRLAKGRQRDLGERGVPGLRGPNGETP